MLIHQVIEGKVGVVYRVLPLMGLRQWQHTERKDLLLWLTGTEGGSRQLMELAKGPYAGLTIPI